MLDAVDKVIKRHIQNLLSVNGKPITVFSNATADQDDQDYSQAGIEKQPDRVELPFASLIRLPNIDITDDAPTKRVHNYSGYSIDGVDTREGIASAKLSYYRCTLHYTVTIFAENRKLSEDLATALYGRLRNHCEVPVSVALPVEVERDDKGKDIEYVRAGMNCDIALDAKIEQANQQKLDQAQVYKCRISFDVRNVNIYTPSYEKKYKFRVFIEIRLDDEIEGNEQRYQLYPPYAGENPADKDDD